VPSTSIIHEIKTVPISILIERDLKRRIADSLDYYAFYRPHQSLGGATPAEIYLSLSPAHLSAIPPPRGRPDERVASDAPVIAYLDPERRLPILIPRAA
jgi:hypothetical protein